MTFEVLHSKGAHLNSFFSSLTARASENCTVAFIIIVVCLFLLYFEALGLLHTTSWINTWRNKFKMHEHFIKNEEKSLSAVSTACIFLYKLKYFAWSLLVLPQKQHCYVFNSIKLKGLGWMLHDFNSVGLKPRCCTFTAVFGSLSHWNTYFRGMSSLA